MKKGHFLKKKKERKHFTIKPAENFALGRSRRTPEEGPPELPQAAQEPSLQSLKRSQTNESTRETSDIKIKWNSDSWPRIELELHFGSCIGQGSFAKVYEGIDKKSKMPVGIKVISKRKLRDDKRKKLVQKEIEIISKMKHANIGAFYRMLEDHKRVSNLIK